MAEETQGQGEIVKPSAFISDRHRNPAEMMAVKSNANYTLAGICAILATLVFAAMLVVLWLDWSALKMA
jgi:hypothetical protein